MIAALDVQYDDGRLRGNAAAVVFEVWDAGVAIAEYTAAIENIQPYRRTPQGESKKCTARTGLPHC
jgi:hypothetical protein